MSCHQDYYLKWIRKIFNYFPHFQSVKKSSDCIEFIEVLGCIAYMVYVSLHHNLIQVRLNKKLPIRLPLKLKNNRGQ